MEESVIIGGRVNPAGYQKMAQAVKVSSETSRAAALSTGMFEVQQLRLNSASEEYSKSIERQKLSLKKLWQEYRTGGKVREAAYKEQLALQNMVVKQMPGTIGGKKVLDVYIPNEVTKSMDTFSKRLGFMREELRSASTSMINWGKNTQWAGRQLMVGFTIPVAAFGAAAAVMTYQVDQQLTKIKKVYDTTAQGVQGDTKSMIAVHQELGRVAAQAMATAANATKQYGSSVTDTLSVQAQLAAAGKKGFDLQQATMQTMRIATLGELNPDQAVTLTNSLQSAFRKTIKNADDLSNAFNYMNAVENQTSLTTQDMADSIPRAAGAMANLGVSVQQMVVLLASMKENGVDAAEGANALKSATVRAIKPVPAAIKLYQSYGIAIRDIAAQSGGNLFEYLKLLGKEQEKIQGPTQKQTNMLRQQALATLFGTYQNSRLSGSLQSLTDAFDKNYKGVSQTRRAVELMGKSTGDLSAIADNELATLQQSISQRFKTAVNQIKLELANVGKPFLEIGLTAIGIIDKILHAFNSLPGGVKKGFAALAIGAAVMGPLVMLAGLTANFAGNLLKMGVGVLGLATDFKLLNKETRAAQLITKLADAGFVNEAKSMSLLTAQMRALTQASQEASLAQKAALVSNKTSSLITNGVMGAHVPVDNIDMMGRQANGQLRLVSPISPKAQAAAAQAASDKALQEQAERNAATILPTPAPTATPSKGGGRRRNSGKYSPGTLPRPVPTTSGLTPYPVDGPAYGPAERFARPSGDYIVSGGQKIPRQAMIHADDAKELEASTKRTSGWLKAGAVSGGIMAASMATMMVTSNKTANNVAQFAMVASMVAPAVAGMVTGLSKIPWANMTTGINNFAGKVTAIGPAFTGAIGKFRSGLRLAATEIALMGSSFTSGRAGIAQGLGMATARAKQLASASKGVAIGFARAGESIFMMMSPVAWLGVAIGAVVGGLILWEKHSNQAANNIHEIYSDAKGLGEILNYAPTDTLTSKIDSAGQTVSGIQAKADQFTAKYKNVTKAIHDTKNEQDAFNLAMAQGLKVIQTGGTAEQAKQAVEIALRAAKGKAEADKIILKFQPQMDFSNVDNIVNSGMAQIDALMKKANKIDLGSGNAPTGVTQWLNSHKTTDWIAQSKDEGAFAELTAAAAEAGKAAGVAYTTALDNNIQTANVAAKAQEILNGINKKIKDSKEGSKERLAAEIEKEQFLQGLVKGRVTDEKAYVESLKDGATVFDIFAGAGMAIVDSTGKSVTNAKELNAALAGSAGGADDTASGAANAASNIDDAAAAAQSLQDALSKVDWVGTYKTAMQDTQSDLASIASNNFSTKMNNAMDAYKKAQDKRMDSLKSREESEDASFDARWERRKKAVSNAYDARIKHIKDVSDAEKKAEDLRQKMFQAEITRMQRLAEMANSNVDFNAALNSGNLDEAAKIQNDVSAKQADWALSDSADQSQTASQARQDRLGNKSDKVSAAKDRAASALDAQEKAEKASLDRRQKMREDALQTEIDNNVKAQQEIWDNRKEKLDKAIELFKNYVPKNAADLRAHIAAISKAYSDFNVATKGEFNVTSVQVGKMLKDKITEGVNGVKDGIAWGAMGSDIATDMITNAFGMSVDDFMAWMSGSPPPKGFKIGRAISNTQRENKMSDAGPYHTGGIVGKDTGGWAGMKGHRDEVKATLLKGEGVLNRGAMKRLGTGGFAALNSGYGTDYEKPGKYRTGGAGDNYVGFAGGLLGTLMYGAMQGSIAAGIVTAAKNRHGKKGKSPYQTDTNSAGLSSPVPGGFINGGGGRHRPVPRGYGLTQGLHDQYTGYPAIDIGVPVGTPIYAAADGKVIKSYDLTGSDGRVSNGGYHSYGRVIYVDHGGYNTLYAHLSQRYAQAGQTVKGGAKLGLSGNTGHSFGPHLHFGANGGVNPNDFMGLKKGAQNINVEGLYNLHKNEAVLTEDINNKFKEGVNRFAEGPSSQYNLHMTVNGANVNADEITNKVMTAFRRMEARKPQSRGGK